MIGTAIAVLVVLVLGGLTLAVLHAAGKASRNEEREELIRRCGGRVVVHGGPQDVSAGLQRAAAREYPKAVVP